MATRVINDYTSMEKDALERKLYNPHEKVECPRCGEEIIYSEVGNSSSAKCPTDGCIKGSIRGL